MTGTVLIWIAAGALGGMLACRLLRGMAYTLVGDSLLGMLAGLLGGVIVVMFDGIGAPHLALGSGAVAFLAGLLQILTLRLVNNGRRPTRW